MGFPLWWIGVKFKQFCTLTRTWIQALCGYRTISNEDCATYLPKQKFMQNPQVDFYYFGRKSYYQIDTN